MAKAVVYLDADNQPALLIPSNEALSRYTIEEIAEKDIPEGLSYKVIDTRHLPSGWHGDSSWFNTIRSYGTGVGGTADVFRDNPSHPDYVAPVVVDTTTE